MSALKFLNKKSWHTSTIKNNEKVWLREQEAAREKARTEELQKQIAEEHRQEELRRLEEASGRVDETAALRRGRINWMYEHNHAHGDASDAGAAQGANAAAAGSARDKADAEDVLLGKKAADLEGGDAAQQREERALLVDAEAKMREDPLVAIQLAKARVRKIVTGAACDGVSGGVADGGVRKMRPDKDDAKRRERAARKEQRRQIREERRVRREERVRRQEGRSGERSMRDASGMV